MMRFHGQRTNVDLFCVLHFLASVIVGWCCTMGGCERHLHAIAGLALNIRHACTLLVSVSGFYRYVHTIIIDVDNALC